MNVVKSGMRSWLILKRLPWLMAVGAVGLASVFLAQVRNENELTAKKDTQEFENNTANQELITRLERAERISAEALRRVRSVDGKVQAVEHTLDEYPDRLTATEVNDDVQEDADERSAEKDPGQPWLSFDEYRVGVEHALAREEEDHALTDSVSSAAAEILENERYRETDLDELRCGTTICKFSASHTTVGGSVEFRDGFIHELMPRFEVVRLKFFPDSLETVGYFLRPIEPTR